MKKISNDLFFLMKNVLNLSPEEFFDDESACLCTFRVLPEICQHIIIRAINVPGSLSKSQVYWKDLTDNKKQFEVNMFVLTGMGVIQPVNKFEIRINDKFKTNLQKIFSHGITPPPIEFKKKRKAFSKCLKAGIDALSSFVNKIFMYENLPAIHTDTNDINMTNTAYTDINSTTINTHTINEAKHFLLCRNFITEENSSYKLTSTSLGLLLSGKSNQVIYIIKNYISYFYEKFNDRNVCVAKTSQLFKLLFNLSLFEIGAFFHKLPPPFDNDECYEHLHKLAWFGVVIEKTKSQSASSYYVTPLIKVLFEDSFFPLEDPAKLKFIIVETNFRLYAYPSNELEIKFLEFVFEIEYSFPEFIVGRITRNAMRRLFKRGVKAITLLNYLSVHAHAKVDEECVINGVKYKLPENVAQQIIIWEEEKNAIEATEAMELYDFKEKEQYDYYIDIINKKKIPILWNHDPSKRIIVPSKHVREIDKIEKNYSERKGVYN